MLLVTLKLKNERLVICRACKHYVKATQSCGTLGLGKEVPYKNTKKKLCGCIMPIKAHLKIASCPIHKWKSEIAQEDIEAIKNVLGSIENRKVTAEQNMLLTKYYNKVMKTRKNTSNCSSCVRKIVKELTELIESE